jgi:hypothetical protein
VPKIVQEFHKAVVIATTNKNKDGITLGFASIADAIFFVSEQVTDEVEKMDAIKDSINETEGIVFEDGSSMRILDVETYMDLYEESDEDDDV